MLKISNIDVENLRKMRKMILDNRVLEHKSECLKVVDSVIYPFCCDCRKDIKPTEMIIFEADGRNGVKKERKFCHNCFEKRYGGVKYEK